MINVCRHSGIEQVLSTSEPMQPDLPTEHDGLKFFKLWTKILIKKSYATNGLCSHPRCGSLISKLDSRCPKSTSAATTVVGDATFSPTISKDGTTSEPRGRGAEHERVLSVVEWQWRTEQRPGWRSRWRDGWRDGCFKTSRRASLIPAVNRCTDGCNHAGLLWEG